MVQGLFWEGSTTVVYTVVWRNSMVWGEGGNTALWLVRHRDFLHVPSMNYQAMGSFSANHSAVYPPTPQTRQFRQTKRQCKLQWLTPPTVPTGGKSGRDWYRQKITSSLHRYTFLSKCVHIAGAPVHIYYFYHGQSESALKDSRAQDCLETAW